MARIQILNLPGDGNPFALVIDRADWPNASATLVQQFNGIAEQVGARGVIAFGDTIEIVGQQAADASATTQLETFWRTAADRNGELYSACENQRDDARQGLTELRARMSALADKLDEPGPKSPMGVSSTRVFAAHCIREILDGASIST